MAHDKAEKFIHSNSQTEVTEKGDDANKTTDDTIDFSKKKKRPNVVSVDVAADVGECLCRSWKLRCRPPNKPKITFLLSISN